jgi:hypothetical protein
MKLKILAIALLLGTLTACGSQTTIEPVLPCPDRPELIQVDPEFEVSPHVQAIVAENYLRLIQYAQKLEARAQCSID